MVDFLGMEGILDIFIYDYPVLFCLYWISLRLASSIIPSIKYFLTLANFFSFIVIILAWSQIRSQLFFHESLLLGEISIWDANRLDGFGLFVGVVARWGVEIVSVVKDFLGFRKMHDEYNLKPEDSYYEETKIQ